MKLFIHLVFFLGTVSLICFADAQRGKKGRKPNQPVLKSSGDHLSVYTDTAPIAKAQKDEVDGQSEVGPDNKNTVPPVGKDDRPLEDQHILEMQENIQENDETVKPSLIANIDITLKHEELGDPNPTTVSHNNILAAVQRQKAQASEQSDAVSESKNTVPPVTRNTKSSENQHYLEIQEKIQYQFAKESSSTNRPTEAPNVIVKGVESADSNSTSSNNGTSTSPAIKKHNAQAGDQSEETSECEDKQKRDMKKSIEKNTETLCRDGQLEGPNEFLKIPEQNQATLPIITNGTGSNEGIKQEGSFTLNVTQFTQEQAPPTPPPCPTVWPTCLSDQFDNTVSEVSKELMTFSLHLFQKLSSMDSKPNLVVSPISVALALTNLMLGSGGATRDDMLKTLYNGIKDIGCIHEAIKNLTAHDSVISASNFFYKKDLHIHDEFIEQSYRFYGAKGLHLGSDDKKNLDRINSWVSEKTKQLIPTLLQELPSDLQMILVNVIYYQGKWLSKFDPSHTKKEAFYRPSLGLAKVPMMNSHKYPLQNIRDSYLQAQVARFPLSDNCSLLILLPQSQGEDALKKMTKKLNQEVVNILMAQLEEMPMKATYVSLPQLKLDTNLLLNDALRTLGLYNLFEYPNLCALSKDSELVVSDIHHRAVLEVNEEGVKAAAATTISVARTASVFAVRRPFLFILVSDQTRVPILIGRVTDPSQ